MSKRKPGVFEEAILDLTSEAGWFKWRAKHVQSDRNISNDKANFYRDAARVPRACQGAKIEPETFMMDGAEYFTETNSNLMLTRTSNVNIARAILTARRRAEGGKK